jgi:hypothetical protein
MLPWLNLFYMSRKRGAILLSGCFLACCALVLGVTLSSRTPRPHVRVGITDYFITNGTLIVTAIATNLGPALGYSGSPPQREIQWRSDGDWISEPQRYVSQSASTSFR